MMSYLFTSFLAPPSIRFRAFNRSDQATGESDLGHLTILTTNRSSRSSRLADRQGSRVGAIPGAFPAGSVQ